MRSETTGCYGQMSKVSNFHLDHNVTILHYVFLKGQSQPLFVYFRSFQTIIQIQIEKAKMLCLGFNLGPQDGRRK